MDRLSSLDSGSNEDRHRELQRSGYQMIQQQATPRQKSIKLRNLASPEIASVQGQQPGCVVLS